MQVIPPTPIHPGVPNSAFTCKLHALVLKRIQDCSEFKMHCILQCRCVPDNFCNTPVYHYLGVPHAAFLLIRQFNILVHARFFVLHARISSQIGALQFTFCFPIGPLHDPVTWYGINYTGTQITQWDFQNKGTHTSPARLPFGLKVPLSNLRPSVIYSVPCDRIVQRAYCPKFTVCPPNCT